MCVCVCVVCVCVYAHRCESVCFTAYMCEGMLRVLTFTVTHKPMHTNKCMVSL